MRSEINNHHEKTDRYQFRQSKTIEAIDEDSAIDLWEKEHAHVAINGEIDEIEEVIEKFQTPPAEKKFLTYTVDVTIEKRITVHIDETLNTPEQIKNWCEGLWHIEGIEDIAKHAAVMAAQGYEGHSLDGLGLLKPTYSSYPREGDTQFQEEWSDVESVIVKDGAK